MRRLLLGLAACISLVIGGCAASAPPMPPLAEPLATESQAEYRWALFKWRPGVTVAYDTSDFFEITSGNGTERRSSSRGRFVASGRERTARGLVPVEMILDGEKVGELFVDDAGRASDVVMTGQKADAEVWQSLGATMLNVARMQEPLEAKQLRLNEPVSIGVGLADMLGSTLSVAEGAPETMVSMTYTFAGYRRVLGLRTAEVKVTMLMPRTVATLDAGGGVKRVQLSLLGEGTRYRTEAGLDVATYMTSAMEIEMDGKRLSVRTIMVTTLDKLATSGILSDE